MPDEPLHANVVVLPVTNFEPPIGQSRIADVERRADDRHTGRTRGAHHTRHTSGTCWADRTDETRRRADPVTGAVDDHVAADRHVLRVNRTVHVTGDERVRHAGDRLARQHLVVVVHRDAEEQLLPVPEIGGEGVLLAERRDEVAVDDRHLQIFAPQRSAAVGQFVDCELHAEGAGDRRAFAVEEPAVLRERLRNARERDASNQHCDQWKKTVHVCDSLFLRRFDHARLELEVLRMARGARRRTHFADETEVLTGGDGRSSGEPARGGKSLVTFAAVESVDDARNAAVATARGRDRENRDAQPPTR
ncbi:MAG: hypothetical protein QM817_09415 [Archangium sp.]